MDIEVYKGYQRSCVQSLSPKGTLWIIRNRTHYMGNFSFMIDTEHLSELITLMREAGLEILEP